MNRIGVIIPVYNSGFLLFSTVNSILAQEGDYKCHITIVNDFSTDKTTHEVLTRFINHPCVTVINNASNIGICESRNKGLRLVASSVDFVMFVDHDDVLVPLAFQKLIDTFKRNPNTIAVMGIAYKFGPLVTAEENEAFIESQRNRRSISFYNGRFYVSYESINLLTYPALLSSYTFHPPAKALIRINALVSSGVIFEKRFELVEDWIFWIRLLKCGEIYAIDEVTAGYCWHKSNNSHGRDQVTKLKQAWKYLFWYSLHSRTYLFSYLNVVGANREGTCNYYKSFTDKTIVIQMKYWYNLLLSFVIKSVIKICNITIPLND